MRTLRLAAVLVVAGLALGACADDEPPEWLVERATPTTTTSVAVTSTTAPSTTAPDPGRELAVIDLEPGVCIEDASAFTGTEVNEITQTRAIACRLPHEAEVYLRRDLAAGPDAPFPGVAALRNQAQVLCRDGFEAFVGVRWTRSELEIAALWPSPPSWAEGDRLVVCAVFRLDGQPLTGSAEGSRI
jgi:hypothetical protein